MKKSVQILLPVLIIGLLVVLYVFKNKEAQPLSQNETPVAQSTAEASAPEGILEMVDEYDLAAWKAEQKPLLIEFSTDS